MLKQTLLQIPNGADKYIELDIEAVDDSQYGKKQAGKQSQNVNFQEEIQANAVCLLEAEMGYGKSRFARRIISELVHPETLRSSKIIPIFQPFGVFAENDYENIDQRLKALVGGACYAEARAGGMRFLLVLDGIDEMVGNVDRRREVLTKLMDDVRKCDYLQVLLTSRPFKLLEDIPGASATVKRYRIRPVSIAKLIRFIVEVCQSVNLPKRLYQDLAKSNLFKQLPQNPIAASLLSNLLSQSKQDLPSNLTELYSKSVEFMLGRWDEKRGLSTEKLYRTCERAAREIARYVLDNKLIYLSAKEARDMIVKLLADRNLGVTDDEVVNYLFSRSHVFGSFEDAGTIFFRHRSLAEYLYALDCHQRRDLSIDEKVFNPYWTNIYYFYIGLLGECPDLLRKIVAFAPKDETSRWVRCLQIGNYLLAGDHSPYSIVEETLHIVLSDLAQLYLDVKGGKTKTRLVDLSEIQLLYLFSMLSKHVFGYEFFRKALPLAMLQLDEEALLDDERKIYGLFFAASALRELEDNCGFRFLLEKHKTDTLPLPISLGIRGETDSRDKRFAQDPAIRLHEKKLRKLLTTDHENKRYVQQRLEELYERPISARPKAIEVAGRSKSGRVL